MVTTISSAHLSHQTWTLTWRATPSPSSPSLQSTTSFALMSWNQKRGSHLLLLLSSRYPSHAIHLQQRSKNSNSENDLEPVHFSPCLHPCSLRKDDLSSQNHLLTDICLALSGLGSRSRWVRPSLTTRCYHQPHSHLIFNILSCFIFPRILLTMSSIF